MKTEIFEIFGKFLNLRKIFEILNLKFYFIFVLAQQTKIKFVNLSVFKNFIKFQNSKTKIK
jgi:hypothetical protein